MIGQTRHIGLVEVLRARTYPLDPYATNDDRTTVVVEPGRYPLYTDGLSTFWVMTGVLNEGGFRRHGDGMFTLIPHDIASGIELRFPSQVYGRDEWREFLALPVCVEGHPEQRLRIMLDAESES